MITLALSKGRIFDETLPMLAKAGIKLVCLSHYDALLPIAVKRNYVSSEMLDSLAEWRKDPGSWKQG